MFTFPVHSLIVDAYAHLVIGETMKWHAYTDVYHKNNVTSAWIACFKQIYISMSISILIQTFFYNFKKRNL